ncbi:MAG: hypothetical protein IPM95_00110 [Sphingobacteriales bacterium]|nr:hypothetical protein [Sphingobacteriales bacterium]
MSFNFVYFYSFFLLSCNNVAIKKDDKHINLRYIDSIEFNFKKKYDSGENMLEDSRKHFLLLDSILKEVELNLKDCIKNEDTSYFRIDFRDWHIKKDSLIKNEQYIFDQKFKSGEWGSDMYMILYYNGADFIVKRIRFLLKYKEKNCYISN